MRPLRALALAVLAAALWPSHATAQGTCNAPPGTAAVEQYCEWVPSASGDRRPRQPGQQPTVPVPADTVRELAKSAEGRELAEFLGQDPAKPKSAGGGGRKQEERAAPVSPAPSDNPLEAVRSAIAAGPGVSGFLPGAILAVTVIMLGWAWVSFRRRGRSD